MKTTEPKEHGLIACAAMIRAFLEDRKSQTRRIEGLKKVNDIPGEWSFDGTFSQKDGGIIWRWVHGGSLGDVFVKPKHTVGTVIYVKETHALRDTKENGDLQCVISYQADLSAKIASMGEGDPLEEHAFEQPKKWRPSIFMPKWASRIRSTVSEVRVQRVQDISEEDAKAEGVESPDTERAIHDFSICPQCGGTGLFDGVGANLGIMPDCDCQRCDTFSKRFRWLWESINGPESWDANPWVFAYSLTK